MNSFKTLMFLLTLFLFKPCFSQEIVDHSAWDQMLILNVTKNGLVDYEGVTNDVVVFYTYFRYLQSVSPKDFWSKEEKLAYWINVYNATAMKMIIDEYPISSINDIENPWKKKVFKSEGVRYSLDQIEHDILRQYNDPRIHFLLNCGSMSSPRLWDRAYTAENINEALQERTREFINDPQRNQITANSARLSEIFKWYEEDFTGYNIDVIDFINRYTQVKILPNAKVKYVTYDWNLNKKIKDTQITTSN
ncbi:DUF547 domain-containing protein [Aquimarina sp. W85]|uniref:DUF547 domain-containing protein n=1 Tax=Aquimarina rhodophyticola TaxID=3342246 RepID=UPI00366C1727